MRVVTSAASTAILVIELAHPCLAAQDFRGTIQGRVTDPQGGAIPHVTVLVTNEATGVDAEGLTESDGAYAVPFLLPGRYRVEVALPGFKKFVQSGIAVGVAQRATVDVTLTLGEVTETVDVRAEASLLDRASGALGQTIDAKRVEDMPLKRRAVRPDGRRRRQHDAEERRQHLSRSGVELPQERSFQRQ